MDPEENKNVDNMSEEEKQKHITENIGLIDEEKDEDGTPMDDNDQAM